MKKLAIVSLLALISASAFAGVIQDIQTGAYAEFDEVVVTGAVVVAERYNGVFISEDPNGLYAGIWVYTGGAPLATVGDLVDVKGLYKEYYEFSEIDVPADSTGYLNNAGVHMGTIYPIDVTVNELASNPEPYESCFIRVTSGMMVTQLLGYGEWEVESVESPGAFLVMDDYWYDDTTVALGDCYNCAVGVLIYSYGAFKLEPFEGAISVVDCAIGTEESTFSQVKKSFR